MEIIRKQISMDSLRSHESGILPFINYNSDDQYISTVSPGNENGNYGSFVCDFVFENAIGEFDYSPRMKYMDALRRYMDSKEIMENGILVKRYEIHDSGCPSTYTGKIYWSPNFTLHLESAETACYEELERFGTEMVDINDFEEDFNGNYTCNNTIYDDREYLLLVHNYSSIELNNQLWNNWWNYWWPKDTSTGVLVDCWEEKYLVDVPSKYKNPTFECYRFIWDFERYVLGKIFVPERIVSGSTCVKITGTKVPKFVYYTNYGKYITLIDNEKKGSKEWKERGGQEFRDFLIKINPIWKSIPLVSTGISFTYLPSEIDIPILFEDEIENETLYSPYEWSVTDDGSIEDATIEYETKGTLYPHFSLTSGYVETKIDSLTSIDAINIENDLYGRFQSFADDKSHMFKCVYSSTGWSYTSTGTTGIRCADGERVGPNQNVYRNATIASCVESMVEEGAYGFYFILARYDNSQAKPFTFPFKVGEPCNVSSIDSATTICDVVTNINTTSIPMTVEYVLGATIKFNTDGTVKSIITDKQGIHYTEEFKYETGKTKVYIDGQYEADLYYERASNDGLYTEMYNEELRLSRLVKTAKITGMEVGTTWTLENAVKALLFTKEGMESLQEEPIYNVDVTFDRGLATAWESHFKLSECNTLEDLIGYSNGFFGL